jgi:CheY-like chemotaxis protein
LRRFFTQVDNCYQICKSIRDIYIFSRHDLSRDPPFARLDLITCRNLLIYLNLAVRRRVLPLFHYALKPTGYLMLGPSETLGAFSELFTPVNSEHKIFAKKMTATRPPLEFDLADSFMTRGPGLDEMQREPVEHEPVGFSLMREVDRLLLSQFAPAGVLVDDDLRIIQFRGQTDPYLAPAPGLTSFDLLKMAREGLTAELRTAVNLARDRNEPVRRSALHIGREGSNLPVEIEVRPLRLPASGPRYFLVLFEPRPGPNRAKPPPAESGSPQTEVEITSLDDSQARRQVIELRRELDVARDYLLLPTASASRSGGNSCSASRRRELRLSGPTAARTNSSPCLPTSCATRWRPSSTRFWCSARPTRSPRILPWAIKILERQVRHMSRLIEDLLEASRVMRGAIQLRKEPSDLSKLIDQAIEVTRSFIETRRHQLTVNLPEEPITLNVDPLRIEQVVTNLLHNAAKYTPEGGQINLSVAREGSQAVIRVRDNGIGIAPEHIHEIFDLFMQVDNSLERSLGGLGIGLTLVKSLTEMHAGSVEAQSGGLGEGSEFTIRLPALPSQIGSGQVLAASPPAIPPRKVLIVDDSQDSTESLSRLLRSQGHEVRTALDGASALAVADEFRPDLVLLDIGMPLISGFEVASMLRVRPEFDDVIIIAVSGYGQEETLKRSHEASFDDYAVKPIDLDKLNGLMRRTRRRD